MHARRLQRSAVTIEVCSSQVQSTPIHANMHALASGIKDAAWLCGLVVWMKAKIKAQIVAKLVHFDRPPGPTRVPLHSRVVCLPVLFIKESKVI